MNPIVGIGELLWDVYPDGRKVAGGAPFNFAFHCHQLGHPAVIVSRVGNDDLGRELRERVRELGLSDEYIQTDDEHPTGTVQVTLDANAVPAYTITENVAWDHIAWDEKLKGLAGRVKVVCYGTLASRVEPSAGTIRDFVSGQQVFRVFDVNLRQHFFTPTLAKLELDRAQWVKWSEQEAATVMGFDSTLLGMDSIMAVRVWYSSSARGLVSPGRVHIVTRGPEGVDLNHCPGYPESFHVPGVPAKVVDTVGAGDSFTAAMVCLHLEGRPLRECAQFAVHYAARVCEQPGGTPRIDRQEVERAAFQK